MSENKSLCAYPWMAACLNPDGLVRPCCTWQSHIGPLNIFNSNTTNDPINSNEWNKIREDMISGKPVKGCEWCYSAESAGKLSSRLSSLFWMVPTESKPAPLEYLEVTLSNLCNLACVGCWDGLSTKWSSENIKAGRPGQKLIDNRFDWSKWDLSRLNKLKILGGEPFMEMDRFSNLLEHVDLSKIKLIVYTNGTILPNKRLKLLIEKCKNVEFIVSLDGIDTVNEWIRWPSKFDKVTANMRTYESWWNNNNNIELATATVVNIFNIFIMDKFIDFKNTNFSSWSTMFNWVFTPSWQSIQALPVDVKNTLIDKFKDKTVGDLKTFWKNHQDFYKISIEYLKMSENISWETVKNKTLYMAEERKLSINNMLPDFKKIMDNY